MQHLQKIYFSTVLFLTMTIGSGNGLAAEKNQIVRVAVVAGLTRTGVWSEIVKRFEDESGRKVEVVTGQRPEVAKALREGRVDCAAMHSGDVATALITEGFGTNLMAWARNEYVIVGPRSDPARVKGLNDAATALKRISATQSAFVNHEGAGSRELGQALWEKAGVMPAGKWFLDDDSGDEGVVAFAAAKNAYVMASHNPRLKDDLLKTRMEIMVESDPMMRRSFLFMEASSGKFPAANHAGARALGQFLLADKFQSSLSELGKTEPADRPFLYPAERLDKGRR